MLYIEVDILSVCLIGERFGVEIIFVYSEFLHVRLGAG